jgi:hypothetical protein
MFDDTDSIYEVGYGTATSDGGYDSVATYDNTGQEITGGTVSSNMTTALVIVVLSLGTLWFMGASIFKGSNQS